MMLIITTLLFHIIPNIIMAVIKNTHEGHKVLTGSFSAGIELGRSGKVFNKGLKQFMKYGVGPEALIEYELGLKLGNQIFKMSDDEQEAYLIAFKKEIMNNYKSMSNEEKEETKHVPFINSVISYAKGDINTMIEEAIIKTSQDVNASSVKGSIINVLVLAILTTINAHILIQPVICFIREKVGMSKIGKTVLKNNFKSGINGNMTTGFKSLIIDMLVSPSTLDTMRLGYSLKDSYSVPAILTILEGTK